MTVVVLRIVAMFAILFLFYVALVRYARWATARTLEDAYDAEDGASASRALTRDDYVARGLARYERSWQRKALVAVVVLPPLIVFTLSLLAT